VQAPRELAGSLRDWLDAYRYFDIPLFADDPAVREFVRKCAHRSDSALSE